MSVLVAELGCDSWDRQDEMAEDTQMLGEQPAEPSVEERISKRISDQTVDVNVPQAVEQVLEVPKIPSRDRNLQWTVEQIPDVLVPEMAKQLVGVAETVSLNRTQ